MIADAGGTSGIQVNGKKVASAPVTGLDDVRIGEFRLKVELMQQSQSFKAPDPAPAPSVSPGKAAPTSGRRDPFATRPIVPISSLDPDHSRPPTPARQGGLVDDLMGGSSPPPPPQPSGEWEPATQRLEPKGLPPPPPLVIEDEPTRKRPNPLSLPPAPKKVDPTPLPQPPQQKKPTPSKGSRDPTAIARISKDPGPGPTTKTGKKATLPPPPAPSPDKTPLPVIGTPSTPPPARTSEPPATAIVPSYVHDMRDDEDEDDDHDDDRHFEPPFSLLDNVVRDRFKTPVRAEPDAVVEVIRYRDSRLFDVKRVSRGDRFSFVDPRTSELFDLLRLKKNGRARLFFDNTIRGNVVIGGETAPFANLCDDNHKADKKGHLFVVEIGEGDFAHVKLDGGEGYLVRFVRPPLPPPKSYAMNVSREDRLYGFSAFLAIIFLLGAIYVESVISPPEVMAMEEEVEFAEVSLKDLELEKPEPTPTPEPTPEPIAPAPPEEKAPPEPKKHKKEKREPRQAPVEQPPPEVNQASKDAASALAALDNIAPRDSKNLSAAVSNIAAVRVPNGTAKRFAMSGPIGKLPGNEVVLSTGSTGRDTRAAAKLMEGNNVGAMKAETGGRVRGTVARVPARDVGTQGGSLSREEILKVVNAGIGDIQRCYERELMRTPGLDGKVVMDWIISPSGSVQSTRVRSSTLKSEAVTACIGGVIKGWQFPKPTGGSVTVTFPFAFRGQNF